MDVVRQIFCILLTIYWLVLFVRIIFSWFPPPTAGPGRAIFEVIYDLTEPILGLVRGLLPAIRMGAMGLDLSPIIVFVAIAVLQQTIC
ncbi:MAG TPA: YggT family protein [Actinomycetota bacterium]|jgi:YggT family protein|nr:YggT family protein [Actinomycetota bacterium]